MKIVVIGRSDTLYETIIYLVEKGYDIVLIITCSGTQCQYTRNSEDFQNLARELKIDFIKTENLDEEKVRNSINSHNPDIAISINWKNLISDTIINSFKYGILNAHPGQLPRYKGNSARNWALINGETSFSQTIHFMDSELDAGSIIVQREFSISDETTIEEMYDLTQKHTPKMFNAALQLISKSGINIQTDISKAVRPLRGYPRTEEDRHISWEMDAVKINRLVKASSNPFNGAYTFYKSKILRIWKSDVVIPNFDYLATPGQVVEVRRESGEVLVATGKDFLVMKVIEYENSGMVKPTEIIKSLRTRLGMNVELEILSLIKFLEDKKMKDELPNRKKSG